VIYKLLFELNSQRLAIAQVILYEDILHTKHFILPKSVARLNKEKLPSAMSSTWFKWYRELNNFSRCIVGVTNGCSLSYLEDCEECNEIS
jgi:hypothetical protein